MQINFPILPAVYCYYPKTTHAETLIIHSLGTVNNAEKIKKGFEKCASKLNFHWADTIYY